MFIKNQTEDNSSVFFIVSLHELKAEDNEYL